MAKDTREQNSLAECRVTFEINQPRFIPDSRSSTPAGWRVDNWRTDTVVEGSKEVVAATLRALADKLDPRKPVMRRDNIIHPTELK